MSFSDKLYKILIQGGSWKTILGGLWVTIQISALALLIGRFVPLSISQKPMGKYIEKDLPREANGL